IAKTWAALFRTARSFCCDVRSRASRASGVTAVSRGTLLVVIAERFQWMSWCHDGSGVQPSSKLENALGCEASAHEVGNGDHVAPQPTPAVDKRLGPQRTQGVDDDVLARDLRQEARGDCALFREIDGVRNLRIAERDATAAALLVAEM